MMYLAYFIALFLVIQFMVALINWLPLDQLPQKQGRISAMVSILVPARNEEQNISKLIRSIQEQTYSNFELIICNDQSTDNTLRIIEDHSQSDHRIRLINAPELPQGWLGKNHACHLLAKEAKGEYLLFIDADVEIKGNIIGKVISYTQKHKVGLVSIFPTQQMLTIAEKLTVPIMNFVLLTLLPLAFVRWSFFTSHSAANGQFMFFDAKIYHQYQPHDIVKNNKAEDIAISRFLKGKKIKIACLTGTDEVKCRMYSSYKEAIQGFAKNFASYFGSSFLLAFTFWLITTIGIFVLPFYLNAIQFIGILVFVILTRILVAVKGKQSIVQNLLFAIPQQLVMAQILYYSITNSFNKKQVWKGRNISL